jgi:DNA-binding response OmpR family regulator
MKTKKVFLISFNRLTADFWKQHLNFENAQLFHWTSPPHGINKLNTVCPDVIIIDTYFSKKSYHTCLSEVLKLAANQKIFCLTPLNKGHDKIVFIDERLAVSKLDDKVIQQMNQAINPTK